MLTILDLSWAHTLSGTLLWQRAPDPLAQEDISTLLSMIPT